MKYFLDTEFLEGPQQEKFPISLFRKQTPPTIDLISIGIVAEDGRELYAISKDFNLEEAWNRFDGTKLEKGRYVWLNGVIDGEVTWLPDPEGFYTIEKKIHWIRENVLLPIWRELFFKADLDNDIYSNKQADRFFEDVNSGGYDHYFSFKSLKALISKYGKTNKEIAKEVKDFCTIGTAYDSMNHDMANILMFNTLGEDEKNIIKEKNLKYVFDEKPIFYAYFADYDWVVFCWIFGKMMDLPDGFPMYCKDLKQIMDAYVSKTWKDVEDSTFGHNGITLENLKAHSEYPNQDPSKSHNAIADARWNKKLFQFLKEI